MVKKQLMMNNRPARKLIMHDTIAIVAGAIGEKGEQDARHRKEQYNNYK